jgi:hypothetical protein
MARNIAAIQAQIITAKESDPTLSGYAWSTSKTAIWRIWTYVTAVCIWTLEQLYDQHKAEVTAILAAQKPHTLQWYVGMARKYQHGMLLPAGSDRYATEISDPTIAIVQYAAATELTNMVRIKVAKQGPGTLEKLTVGELDAFSAYMNRVKDAGIRLQITSGDPDNMRMTLAIYYDPLVLSGTGARLDGTDANPVMRAVNNYLASLPFDGVFVNNHLIAALQQVQGVKIAHVVNVEANYAATPYVPVTVRYTPDAGYMTLDEMFFNTHITYIPA